MSLSEEERERSGGSPLMSVITEDSCYGPEQSYSGGFARHCGQEIKSVFPKGHRFGLAMSAIQHGRVYS